MLTRLAICFYRDKGPVHKGDMIYNAHNREFVFSNDANISGSPGILIMTVSDKDCKLSKDTKRINLTPGM